MTKTSILNRDLAALLAQQGHKDKFMVCDAGFAIPDDAICVDLSLKKNTPTVPEVLEEIKKHFAVEAVTITEETNEVNPTRFEYFKTVFEDAEVEVTSIDYFRKNAGAEMKFFIRTGDYTAFSNIALTSGSGNGWYCEN